jgi:hypothetical protein
MNAGMSAQKLTKASLGFAFACGVLAFTSVNARADLSPNQARKALTRIPGFQLGSSAVRVKSISVVSAAAVNVIAEVRTVFRFGTDKQGRWRVAEIRTGQDRWEDVQLIATALKLQVAEGDCLAPDPPIRNRVPVDPSVKRARCLLGSLLRVEVPSDAVRIQEVDPMPIPLASQPSATVVAWVRVDARLVNDKSGWRVTEVRTGNHDWVTIEPVAGAVNEEKQKQARAEMSLITAALEKFRNERGSYIISDNLRAVIDHLNPRYLARVIRLDPWHQPYKYQGERDRFTLRSAGPDGKPDSPDDIELASPSR